MTIEQAQSTKLKPENHKANPRDIGLIFAREYYTFLNRKPNRLYAFYGADSLLVRGDEGEPVPMVKGQEAIRKKIEELKFDNCKVVITQVDSQVSANEGVLISVLGEITNNEQSSQKFAETFFLAPQPNGYYVLNNIFRFLKDKVNINYYQCEEDDDDNNEEDNNKENKADQVEVKEIKEKQPEHVVDHLYEPEPYEPESPSGKIVEQEEVKRKNPKKATKEVTEETSTANKPTAPIQPSVTPAPPLVVTPEVNVHYNNEMSNTYSRDQRTFQPIPNANKSWATLAASNANESVINEPSEVIKSPPTQQHYYSQYQKPELSAQQNFNPSMHLMNDIPHVVNNFNMPPSQLQQQPYQQPQQQQQQQSSMQFHRQPYHQQAQQNQNKDQRIKETQIFVKNITSSMTEEHLTAAFSQFGAIKSVSVKNQSNIAFIEFQSVTSAQKALEQRKVTIGNAFVIAEERRPPNKRYDNTNNNNRRFHPQHNRRGSASSTHTAGVNATSNYKRGAVATSVGQK